MGKGTVRLVTTDLETPASVSKSLDSGAAPAGTCMTSLKSRAIRASIWVIGGYGVQQALRLGSNLILTRLLFPEAFGLMALVNVFMQCLQMFSDVGIAPSIIQNRRGDDKAFLNTAWTVQVLRGVGLWLCSCCIAYPAALLYGQPLLGRLIPLAGLIAIVSGFASTGPFTAQRHLALGRLAGLEVATSVVQLSVTVSLALAYRSVWVLVLGGLIAALVRTVLSHLVFGPTANRFRFDSSAARALLKFGKWIFLNTLIGGLAMHADRILMGKLMPMGVLGVYAIARNLALMPQEVFRRISATVVFPAIAKISHLPREQLRQRLIKHRWPVLVGAAIGLGVAVGVADVVVGTIYDSRYEAAAWMTPILLLGLWPAILSATIDRSLFAIGEPRFMLYGTISRLVFISFALLGAYAWLGTVGAVSAVAAAEGVRYVGICRGLQLNKLWAAGQDLATTAIFLVVVLALVSLRLLLGVGFVCF